MSRSDPLAAWRKAETTLGRARASERAAAQLPERQAMLFRAMAALEDGRRSEVRRVAEQVREAGHVDIASVLDLLATPPDQVDASRVRRQARKAGVDNAKEFPMLDLLRSLAVAHRGRTAPPSPTLRAAKKGRPALDATVVALTSQARQARFDSRLRKWCPRSEQVVVSGRMCRLGKRVDDHTIEHWFPTALLRLSADAWPDLYEDEERQQLIERVVGRAPWDSGHDEVADWLEDQPAADRRRWLATILARLARDIPAGRLHGLAGAAHAAAHLAEDRPETRDLARQLFALDARLCWAENPEQVEPWLLALLWEERRDALTPAARLALADRLLDAAEQPLTELDPDVSLQAALTVAAGSEDLDHVEAIAATWLENMPGRQLRSALVNAGAEDARVELVCGGVAAVNGQPGTAARAALALVDSGRLDAASIVARAIAVGLSGAGRADRYGTVLAPLISSLSQGTPADTTLDCALGLALRCGVLPEALRTALVDRLARPDTSPAAQARTIIYALALDQPERAVQVVRDLGRALRRVAADAADDQALGLVCEALGVPVPIPSEHIHEVLAPLTAFLLRRGPVGALAAARRLAGRPPLQGGLVRWYLAHHPELGRDPWWITTTVATLLPPPEGGVSPILSMLQQVITDALLEHLDQGPTDPQQVIACISQRANGLDVADLARSLAKDLPF